MEARSRGIASFLRLVLLSGVVLVVLNSSPAVFGQIHGVPASVTSLGFGGSTSLTPGVAASVTSLGPNGFGGRGRLNGCCVNPFFQNGMQSGLGRRRHFHGNFFAGSVPVYGIPYTQVVVVQPDAEDDDGYEGPAIFERRGRVGKQTRVVEVERETAVTAQPAAPATVAEVVPQASTMLVFRDGHQSELQNYAIVGDTIFDLTENRSHKIPIADLDLAATRKANDARGVDFQLPGTPGQ